MKYKGFILILLIGIAIIVLIYLPRDRVLEAVAAVGSPAPDFELMDTNGKVWRLSDLRGKVVFINFWATWCSTCKWERPYKERLYEKMQGRPFQMLGILFRDDPRNLQIYFKKYTVSPPTLISTDNRVGRLYGVTGVPETFIIDKEGILRKKFVGPRKWDSPEIIAMIEKWL